ncbi:segregation/condensation protein A [bacterium]|nr:segregation/condensation protein A [bacterium]
MTYRLNLDVFDGPFDLLLYLIKKNEIDIYDIPIAKILEEFMEYVSLIKEMDLEVAGDFILMASTLMHIKSRMLLPKESLALEDGEELDPRADLIRRLLEYKRYKEVAGGLDHNEIEQRRVFWRRAAHPSDEDLEKHVKDEPAVQFKEVNMFDLLTAFKRVVAYATPETFKQIQREEIKTSQKINEILDALEETARIQFVDFMRRQGSKVAMVAAFLALLELARLKAVIIVQGALFDEIEIHRMDEFTSTAREIATSGTEED